MRVSNFFCTANGTYWHSLPLLASACSNKENFSKKMGCEMSVETELVVQPVPLSASRRLQREKELIDENPTDGIAAAPDPANILKWYYVIDGAKDTPYAGGKYLGTLLFPPTYPFGPPRIEMTTPNGRYEVDTRLCLSISDYHPELWNPVWNVNAILLGVSSFMSSSDASVGTMIMDDQGRRALAKLSHQFNNSNKIFQSFFPC